MRIKAKYIPKAESSWSNLPEIWLSGVKPPDFPTLDEHTYCKLKVRAFIGQVSNFVILCTEGLEFIHTRQFRQVVYQCNRTLCVPFQDWTCQASNASVKVKELLEQHGAPTLKSKLRDLNQKLQPIRAELNDDNWLAMNIAEASYAFLASKYGPEPGWVKRADDIPYLAGWLDRLCKLAPTTICIDPFARITASTFFRWTHEPFREWEKQIRIARYPPCLFNKLRCAQKILTDVVIENEYKKRCSDLLSKGLSQERNDLIRESIKKGRLALRSHNINFSKYFAGHDLKAFLPRRDMKGNSKASEQTEPKPEEASIFHNRSGTTSRALGNPMPDELGSATGDLGVPSKDQEADSGASKSTFISAIIPPCAACQCLFFEGSDPLELPPEPLGNNFDPQHEGQCGEVGILALLESFVSDYCPDCEWEYTADLSPKGKTLSRQVG